MKHGIAKNAEMEINLLNVYIKEFGEKQIEILTKSCFEATFFEHDHVIILEIRLLL